MSISNKYSKFIANRKWTRLYSNYISVGYSQLVTIAVQFAAIPFFLSNWGPRLYAEWIVVSGIPVLLAILNPGVSQASASRAGILAAKGKIKSAIRSIQTSFSFALIASFLLTAFATIISYSIDWQKVFLIREIDAKTAAITFTLLTVHLCLLILGNSFEPWFRAIDKTATGYFLLANRRLVDIIITITILASGFGPKELSIGLVITQIAFLIIIITYILRASPWNALGLNKSSIREFKIILRPSIAHMGMVAAQGLTLQGGIQWLNQVAASEVVLMYTMGRTLMRLTIQIGVVSSNALRPELSRLIGLNMRDQASKLTNKVLIFAGTIGASSYIALGFAGPQIITWWSKDLVAISHLQLFAIGAHALINLFWQIPASMIIAQNRHAKISQIYVLSSIASLIIWVTPVTIMPAIYIASIAQAFPEIILVAMLPIILKFKSLK